MAKVAVRCLHCRKVQLRSPSHVSGQVFCDRECRKAYHRPDVACAGCPSTFKRDPLQPDRLYCTWDCFKASRHVTLICVVCDSLFDSYLSEARKREERGHVPCCSEGCRNSYTSLLLGGDGTWVPGGQYKRSRNRGYRWRVVRQQYLTLVRGRCEGCEAPAVEVHHLHPVAAGGDLLAFDNLMACCKSCHENMHWQLAAGHFRCSFEEVRHAC